MSEHVRFPVRLMDVELTRPLSPPDSGVAQILVRYASRPIAGLRLDLPKEGISTEHYRRMLTDASRDMLPAGALGPDGLLPAEGLPPPARSENTPHRATLSVVITTCEASPGLLRTVAGVRRQTQAPDEIIIVDNRPATSGVAQFLHGHGVSGIRLIEEHRAGLSRARNAGLSAATGDVVAFTDDDVEVDPGWVEALTGPFSDPAVACVTGLVLPLEMETAAQCWFEEFGGFSKGFRQRRFDLQQHRDPSPLYPYAAGIFGTGANAAFRATVLRDLGGFDERLGAGTPARGGEDLDIHLSIVRSGWTLVYEPAALIRHSHHRDMAALKAQIHNYGVGLAAMITKRWVSHHGERVEVARRLVRGATYLLSPSSGKNQAKGGSYPAALTIAELRGVLSGPFAYWRSRRAAASR